MALEPLCNIVTPIGMLSYGFEEDIVSAALDKLVPTGVPTALILDSGSTDGGPSKLALGTMTSPRRAYVDDLTKLLRLVYKYKVPLIFTSAGGSGSDDHVNTMVEIIKEIAESPENKDFKLKVLSLYAGIDKAVVMDRFKSERITPCGSCVPPLTEEDITNSPIIVAQMGPEPLLDAMEANPDFDIIIGGRAYDPASYIAYSIFQLKQRHPTMSYNEIRQNEGGFAHMGKIMECGGLCAAPKSAGAVSTIYTNGTFDISPLDPAARCTPVSVAAHCLYENSRPDILRGPGGSLDLGDAKYEQLEDERTARVSGSVFLSSKADGVPYCIKLESARVKGYRSVFMGSIKDPILIRQIDNLLVRVKAYANQQHPGLSGQWDIAFHLFGRDDNGAVQSCGLFLVAEVLAPTQELATSIAFKARIAVIHGPYPEQKANSGNFGHGLGGLTQIESGPCTQFTVYHLMELEAGEEWLNPERNNLGTAKINPLFRHATQYIGQGKHFTETRDQATHKTLSDAEAITQKPIPANSPSTKPIIENNGQFRASKTVGDLAHILRSKNAGPYEITIDVMFGSMAVYELVKKFNFLTRETLAEALSVREEDIIWMGYSDPAQAFKVTIPRIRGGKKIAAGGFLEVDIHGSQQHVGVFNLELPQELCAQLTNIN